MNTGIWKVFGIGGALVIVGAVFLFATGVQKTKKMAFVDNIRLFNEFNLKKEIEKEITITSTARKNKLDSMRLSLELFRKQIESTKTINKDAVRNFETSKQQYLLKEEQMQEDNRAMARKGDEQVWKQLNEYVKEYGKQSGYEFLLGTNGEGNLMYANERNDVTSEVIKFVNEKYTGKK